MKIKLTKQEKNWILYDVGNSAFTLLAATILPIYFNYIAGKQGLSDVQYLAYWGYAVSIATLLTALAGPVFGTVADTKGYKKPVFTIALGIGAIASVALGFAKYWLAFLVVFVIAKVGYSVTLVFYDSMLVDVTLEDRMDEVSSQGYAWGYIGSCVPFVICLLVVLNAGKIGITMEIAMMVSFVIITVWWVIMTLPLLKTYHQKYYVEKKQCTYKIEIHMRRGKTKGIAIDGLPIGSSKELMGLSHIIFFSPEDLGIIKDGPEQRRRFMDMELCQLDKAYLYFLTQYKKILKQRNALLKQIQKNSELKDTLEIWDKQLVENGIRIIQIREQFVEEVAAIMKQKHFNLTGGLEEMEVIYKPNCKADDFATRLFIESERDILLGTTTVGPHRDDMQFYINGQEVKVYGSQGQKRTSALSLKMAEIEIVEKTIGEKPILLLDDVLSELDRNRQNYLLENIKGIQTIITCTGLEEFVKNGININQTFEIVQGKINGN